MKTKASILLRATLCLLINLTTTPLAHAQGRLVAWGREDHGEVSGPNADHGSFIAVAAGLVANTVAIRADGTLVTWGSDNFWQVRHTPAGTFTAAAVGAYHCIAIRTDGTLVSWGHDYYGEVSNTPGGTFIAVAAGFYHTVAIRTDGTLISWGDDTYGQVSGTPAGTFTAVAASTYGNVAIRTDGTLVAWGLDNSGQVSDTPTGTFTAVAAAFWHSVAIRTDGTLVAWGWDSNGEVSGTPAGTFTAVAAGTYHNVAVRTDGTLVSWGHDLYGQVSSTPAGVFNVIAAANNQSVAIGSPEVDNQPPVPTILAPYSGYLASVGEGVSFEGGIDDDGAAGTHTAEWIFSSPTLPATSISGTVSGYSVSDTFEFLEAGVYSVKLVVTDAQGASGEATTMLNDLPAYVVVYDPDGGFVTGGGWILSLPGSIDPAFDAELAQWGGWASFGFVSKYQKGANLPTGQTEFQFHAPYHTGRDLEFQSSSYKWLVVAGARAKFKGEGTINGEGEYGFMLTAIDSQVAGGGDADRFRIKIWDIGTGVIVYDNQRGSDDDAELDDSTILGAGNIVIHK